MGHGKNQRDVIQMSPAEVEAFIHEQRTTTMSTLARDGSIHSIAMWYGFLDGNVAIESKAKAQKVVNLRRDPRCTFLMEAGESYDQLRGVSLVGRGEIVDDPDRMWELGVNVFERYTGPYTDEMKPFVETMLHKRVVVVLHVDRTVSWDHRKLGLPAM
jgi:PPOX class probable F420-dependent enzyme